MRNNQLNFLDQPIRPDQIILKEAILNIIQHEEPMKACQIAHRLTRKFGVNISRYDVNHIIYSKESNGGLLGVVIVRKPDHIVLLKNVAQPKAKPRIAAKARPQIAKPVEREFEWAPAVITPAQPLLPPLPIATGGIVTKEHWNGRYLIRRAIGLGYAFLGFEIIKLLL
jgi:hypothetical protein